MSATSTNLALQGATGNAIAAAGGDVAPWRGSESSTDLLRRIVSRLISLTSNTRQYPGTNNATLAGLLDSAMAQQSGADGAEPFRSTSDVELLQYLAGAIGVDGTETPYPSTDNTLLYRLAVGSVMDPNGNISQLFDVASHILTEADDRLTAEDETHLILES